MSGYYIIDAPVTPYSPPDEIREWITHLKALEQNPEVLDAIEAAQGWLETSEAHYSKGDVK